MKRFALFHSKLAVRRRNLINTPSTGLYSLHQNLVAMSSTTPVSTSREPSLRDENWRFESTGAPCEWAEEYRPGGFHPVNLGDVFQGRYRVIRKLGDGSFSTVWLAKDTQTSKYVALKVMIAKSSSSNLELEILEHLANAAKEDERSRHVMVLLNTFIHEGPNGRHRCLVFQPMGPTASSMRDTLPVDSNKDCQSTGEEVDESSEVQRYPLWMTKRLIHDALTGLSFLHDNNVTHGDVQPGNILFPIQELDSLPEDELRQDEGQHHSTFELKRLDGLEDHWAPKKLFVKQNLTKYAQLGRDLSVKLSDLGSAFWSDQPPKETVTPIGLRAPELILGHHPITTGIDVWAIGCLIYEFLTGEALFVVASWGQDQSDLEETDDDHISQLHDILGPLPEDLKAAWPRLDRWYGPNDEPLNPFGESGDEPSIFPPLEAAFMERKGSDVSEEQADEVCKLIRSILKHNPSERPTAMEVLKHPWFKK
ncbi:hypothetical protein KVT40_007602 [Elsinoe batatas]|uniref:non-specific serine/threonine protein kinase n=1 Tax=Elsinoe batatas TaxID=2601811 RepID=A0A8K0KZ34_9PEZI|nr:hypothetical protein KVT40_007602 [Elsinoe batatas]